MAWEVIWMSKLLDNAAPAYQNTKGYSRKVITNTKGIRFAGP